MTRSPLDLVAREVLRDDVGVIGTRAVLRVHVFDPSYRGSRATARCVVCGDRRGAQQHIGAAKHISAHRTGGAR